MNAQERRRTPNATAHTLSHFDMCGFSIGPDPARSIAPLLRGAHYLGATALMALMCVTASAQGHVRWSAVASYAASEFDAGTTYAAMHGCANCREANPLLRPFASNPSIFFIMGGQAWATDKAAVRLEETGHSRWTRVLEWGMDAAHVAAGVNNLRGMR